MSSPTRELLRMIKISDRHSGNSLYTYCMKWQEKAHKEGVDALVQSFTQFAREIDGGDIIKIQFDTSSNGMTSKGNGSQNPAPLAMDMTCHHNQNCQIVLFYDRSNDPSLAISLKLFLQSILDQFATTFSNELMTLRPLLIHNSINTKQLQDFQKCFKSFDRTVEERLHFFYGPSASCSSPSSSMSSPSLSTNH